MQQLIIILSLFILIGCKKETIEAKIQVIDRHEVFSGKLYPSGQFTMEWQYDFNSEPYTINQSDYSSDYRFIDQTHRYKQVKL